MQGTVLTVPRKAEPSGESRFNLYFPEQEASIWTKILNSFSA